MEWALAVILGLIAIAAVVAGGLAARRALQFCPHCGWIVRRVRKGWLRCPRCKRQYAKTARVRF